MERERGPVGEFLHLGRRVVVRVGRILRRLDERVLVVLDADRGSQLRDAVLARLDGVSVVEGALRDPVGSDLLVDEALSVPRVHEVLGILRGRGENVVVAEAEEDHVAVGRVSPVLASPLGLAAVVEDAVAGDVAVERHPLRDVEVAVGVDLAAEREVRAFASDVRLEVAVEEHGIVGHFLADGADGDAQRAGDAGLEVPGAGNHLDAAFLGRDGAAGARARNGPDDEAQLVVRVGGGRGPDLPVVRVEAGDAAVQEQLAGAHHAVAEARLRRDERAADVERAARKAHRADGERRDEPDDEADREHRHEDRDQDDSRAVAGREARTADLKTLAGGPHVSPAFS